MVSQGKEKMCYRFMGSDTQKVIKYVRRISILGKHSPDSQFTVNLDVFKETWNHNNVK